MRRRSAVLFFVIALFAAACGGSKAGGTPTRVTVGPQGPLDAGLLTETQVRQVPGFASAKVTPLADIASLADPDPRGPCGAKVPVVSLRDAAGVTVLADTIRGAAQLVIRLPKGSAKKYLDARQANTSKGCPEYQTTTGQGVQQRVLLVRVVRLHNEFEQGLAVVTALKIADSVRAATQVEIRRGDILSRLVIFTNQPISNVAVRGLAAVMAENLLTFDE